MTNQNRSFQVIGIGRDRKLPQSYLSKNKIFYRSIKDNISFKTLNTKERINRYSVLSGRLENSLHNDDSDNDAEDFYTPNVRWDPQSKNENCTRTNSGNIARPIQSKNFCLNARTVPKLERFNYESQITNKSQPCYGITGLPFKSSTKSAARTKTAAELLTVVEKSDRIMTRLKNNSKGLNKKPNGIMDSERYVNTNMTHTTNGFSDLQSNQCNPLRIERTTEMAENCSAKSMICLARIKRTSKDAVANNTLQNVFPEDLQLSDYCRNSNISTLQPHNNRVIQSITSGNCSKESMSPTSSDDSYRFKFPNSNRKREEKLRGVYKVVSDSNGTSSYGNNSESTSNLWCLSNKQDVFSCDKNIRDDKAFRSKKFQTLKQPYDLKVSKAETEKASGSSSTESFFPTCFENKNQTIKNNSAKDRIKGMDTQAVLMYLSETLIDSAEQAEMRLMQKIKEYNDLVCKDPPERKVKDFCCQVETLDPRQDIEKRLNEITEIHQQELFEKDEKIKELENGRKKLKQLVKRLIGTASKKAPAEPEVNVANSVSCPHKMLNENNQDEKNETKNGNEELLQALQLENRLLRTLVKEMKSELEQENATILALAKKLELSLAQQKNKEIDAEIVKKLENKLEMQEKLMKQQAIEAKAIARYVIMKYKR